MGLLQRIFGHKSERPSDDEFTYICHHCHNPCTGKYSECGTQSLCRNCGIKLIVPPRIGLQIHWADRLAPATYSPPERAPGVFVTVPSHQLRLLFVGLNVKRGDIDFLWLGGQEIRLDGTPVLKLDLAESSDRTGSLPTLEHRSLLGDKVLRYALLFIKGIEQTIYCATDDGEAHRMLPASHTRRIVRTVIAAVEAGRVRWDQSQPVVGDNPAEAEKYQRRFEKYHDMYLEIPKIDRSVDYGQLLIFEPTFSGYYARYGVSADRLQTDEDFGLLMGSLPIATEEQVLAHHSRKEDEHTDLGKMSIGRAALIGWNFWSNGKLPARTELYEGVRQIGLGGRPAELLKIDQIVHGSFNQMYIARLQRDEFVVWYNLGGE